MFRLASDLHLERHPERADDPALLVPPGPPVLVLAGDLGDPFSSAYARFLDRAAPLFRAVVQVLGNHERSFNRQDPLERARAVAARHGNVRVLEREEAWLAADGSWAASPADRAVRVLGATLWSDIDRDEAWRVADFRCIPGWTHELNQAEHARAVAWLDARLAEQPAEPTVVVTHHAPSFRGTSHPRFAGCPVKCAYAADLDRLLRPPVAAWFHGHTHWSHARVTPGGALLASNAVALPGDDARYDPHATFGVGLPPPGAAPEK